MIGEDLRYVKEQVSAFEKLTDYDTIITDTHDGGCKLSFYNSPCSKSFNVKIEEIDIVTRSVGKEILNAYECRWGDTV